MSIDAFLARVDKFGNPWHGLVEDGQLTLPNTTTKAWTNITIHGSSDVVRLASPPTTSNNTADTTAGRDWRNYALVTGSSRQFYGKNLGANSWVYAPGSGNAYRMRITSYTCTPNSSGGSVSLTILVSPLVFKKPTQSQRYIYCTLSPIGQPPVPELIPEITSFNLLLDSQSETGAKCSLKVKTSSNDVAWGWLEVSVTGTTLDTIEATVSAAKSRGETLYHYAAGSAYVGDRIRHSSSDSDCTMVMFFADGTYQEKIEYQSTSYYSGEVLHLLKLKAEITGSLNQTVSPSSSTWPPTFYTPHSMTTEYHFNVVWAVSDNGTDIATFDLDKVLNSTHSRSKYQEYEGGPYLCSSGTETVSTIEYSGIDGTDSGSPSETASYAGIYTPDAIDTDDDTAHECASWAYQLFHQPTPTSSANTAADKFRGGAPTFTGIGEMAARLYARVLGPGCITFATFFGPDYDTNTDRKKSTGIIIRGASDTTGLSDFSSISDINRVAYAHNPVTDDTVIQLAPAYGNAIGYV